MTETFQIALKQGEYAELYAGEAGGFRVIVCRLKSSADARTIPPAEGPLRNTGERSLPVARPRYQKGYLRLRGQNWEIRFREDYLDGEGRLRRRHGSLVLGSFRTKREAQRAADAYLRPLNQGACRPRMDITLADFWSR